MTLFGIKLERNYWLWIFWGALSIIAYGVYQMDVNNAFLEQTAIKLRNCAIGVLLLYHIRKFELVKIPLQRKLLDVLDAGPSHPHYGQAILGACIYTGLAVLAGLTIILGAQ